MWLNKSAFAIALVASLLLLCSGSTGQDDQSASILVNKASPALSVFATASKETVGSNLTATCLLTGGYIPTGLLTFYFYLDSPSNVSKTRK